MIVTQPKLISEVLGNLEGSKKVFVVGCAACATKCLTGGEKEVAALVEELKKQGKEVTGTAVLDTPCDMRIAKRDLSRSEAVASADAVVLLACGAGTQSIEKVITKKLVPALNPVFVGTMERIGVSFEFCSICGDCRLGVTGGICPVTRCAKSLRNGPCGGAVNGKCEADPERDCAWVLIYEKTKTTGGSGIPAGVVGPRSYNKPRIVKK
jgi:hypothetical protein